MNDMSQKTELVDILSALQKAVTDACAEDDKVIALGEDLADAEGGGILKVTKGLSTTHGTLRIKSTPISEQAIMGAAIGAAIGGYKPIAEIMLMNFTTVAMDMIVNHAAKLRYMSGGQTGVPLVIRTMTGLGFGNGGQHCDYLEAWFAHTAGMKVVAASTPQDSYGLLRAAIEDPDPVMFIENLPLYRVKMPGFIPDSSYRVPLGKAAVQREGDDITIISYARMAMVARQAGEALAESGISAEIIDLRTISPWDRETVIESARKTGRVIIVHEAVQQFGVGAEISSVLHEQLFNELKMPVRRLGAAYGVVPFAKSLENAFAPTVETITTAAREMVGK